MIKEPKIGMKVKIIGPCCGGGILLIGDTGTIKKINNQDSFMVSNGSARSWHCRTCVEEIKVKLKIHKPTHLMDTYL